MKGVTILIRGYDSNWFCCFERAFKTLKQAEIEHNYLERDPNREYNYRIELVRYGY